MMALTMMVLIIHSAVANDQLRYKLKLLLLNLSRETYVRI